MPSDSAENLLLREADIAIRMFRPTQLELISRHLSELSLVATAYQTYIDWRGIPRKITDLYDHDIIELDRSGVIIAHVQTLSLQLRREHFALRSDDQPHIWELIKAGLGVGFARAWLGRDTLGMVALPVDLSIPPLPIWLTTHRELFTSHRIRAIYNALADGLVAYMNG
ncbi:MAG: substrate-binding domain-containing protein [Candidatus Devosia symbiotica]|nr:substrate-binding domain-containing protein [Candidatus Devosia symbiotica]